MFCTKFINIFTKWSILLKFIWLFARNFAICFTISTIMVCHWHFMCEMLTILYYGMVVMRYLQFGSCGNFESQLITSSSYSKVHWICQSQLSALLVSLSLWLLSLLLGSGVSMLRHKSSLSVRERCALTSAHWGRLRVAASVAPPPPPQVAPPPGRAARAGTIRGELTNQTARATSDWRGYRMGSHHHITPCGD